MRRRICLAGATLSAIPLAFGVTAAMAASSKVTKHPKPKPVKPVKVICKTETTVTIAAGGSAVTPPVSQGSEYGSAACGKLLGSGVQADNFTVDDTGDTVATYTLYFPLGSIHGSYDLTPQEGSLNFLTVDYLGTLTVTGGTGAYQGMKGTGTMTCSSADGIHTSCTDTLELKAKA
ncbi:MAG TPA: hypothetical protein VMU39_20190 [Solirubrobacteraceae bacterium]|nr:hypothetical protein [Solirubrobacteraceae bacterium]